MKRKRLDRDLGWGFQGFPYYQFNYECGGFRGLVGYIDILSGEASYWSMEKAGSVITAGAGMKWIQLIPDGGSCMATAMIKPDGALSVCYIDVIERVEYDPDGVLAYIDKYLDAVFTPEGDFGILDMDELEEALSAGDITKSQYEGAINEINKITDEIKNDVIGAAKKLEKLCLKITKAVKSGNIKPLMTKYQQKAKGEN